MHAAIAALSNDKACSRTPAILVSVLFTCFECTITFKLYNNVKCHIIIFISQKSCYLSSINLKTNCPAKLISGQSAISKRDDNLTRQPLSFRVLNNTFLFEQSAQTGFHCRPCHWLICRRGIIHHKDNSLAVGGILCHPLFSLTDVSQSFLTEKSL